MKKITKIGEYKKIKLFDQVGVIVQSLDTECQFWIRVIDEYSPIWIYFSRFWPLYVFNIDYFWSHNWKQKSIKKTQNRIFGLLCILVPCILIKASGMVENRKNLSRLLSGWFRALGYFVGISWESCCILDLEFNIIRDILLVCSFDRMNVKAILIFVEDDLRG